MKRIKILFCILGLLFLYSCFLCKPEKFTIQQKENNSDALRTDGYFFRKFLNGSDTMIGTQIFFRNGISFPGMVIRDSLGNQLGVDIPDSQRRERAFWGIYEINENDLEIQEWVGLSGCEKVVIRHGIILNDTTFVFTSFSNLKGVGHDQRDTFMFRKFSPKPDSTNNFLR